jgi:non-specific serine/threonine protein kinase
VAQLLIELLEAAPGLRVLATSREALQVPGELLYPVAPLPVPAAGRVDAAAGARYPSVELLAERAAAVSPGFAVSDDNAAQVARVCQRLDGIPLAIELAATRLRSLSLAQLAERLDDRFALLTTGPRAGLEHHRTLRAAVDWSFELCTKLERLLWIRAAVFAGTFDLEAAERVCGGDGLPDDEVMEALTGLVDKSVLVPDIDRSLAGDDTDHRRYRLLDTLGQYGLERLRDPATAHRLCGVDEVELRRRHRDFYLELAEGFHADWFGPRQVSWSRRMRAELPNLRAALGFCLDMPGQARAGVRLAGALHYLWFGCGQAREGRLWLERVLAADPRPSRERVRALAGRARIALLQGEFETAANLARDGLEPARRFDEPVYVAEALTVLCYRHLYRGEPAAALALLEEAVTQAAAVDPAHPQVAYAKLAAALGHLINGDPQRAGEHLAESRAICRAHGERWYLGLVLHWTGLQALALPDLAQAAAYGRESLQLRRELDDTLGAAVGLDLLAWVAGIDNDYRRAACLLGAADQRWRSLGGSSALTGPLIRRDETAAAARTALGDTTFAAEFGRGGDLSRDEAIAYALGHRPTHTDRQAHRPDDTPRLTRREREVAELVAEGLANKQIAARLVISPRTVESHVEHLLTKLGLTNRTQLAAHHASRKQSG